MKDAINVKWMGDMAFEASIKDHRILMDAREQAGGHNRGPRPMPMLMASLGGCTGMDVASILNKMKVVPDEFNIRVEGEVAEEHPKLYRSLHLVFEFRGENLPVEKLTRAVELSQEKYCAVSLLLQKATPVTWEIRLLTNS
jgi:putative redox protein